MAKQRKPKKRQKKSGNRDNALKTIVLITAILQLTKAIIELIATLIG